LDAQATISQFTGKLSKQKEGTKRKATISDNMVTWEN
jgi:hypothetical protein